MLDRQTILFSTFEPSGDGVAAQTITGLLRLRPQMVIHALGGKRMQGAGARLIEHTTQRGSMFPESLAQVWSHRARLRRLRSWLGQHRIDALVPVDSPAGNWSICELVRHIQPKAKIVHLVAPQVWAWAPWRIRRLRRLTDQVLCLLPFEPKWFAARDVRAAFVGHPAFDPSCQTYTELVAAMPTAETRLALLPGSRTGEIKRNWPTMLESLVRLRKVHSGLHGVVAAVDDRIAALLHETTRRHLRGATWPQYLTLVTDRTESVLDWCDLALAASGTISLQISSRLKPMVIMYNMSWLTIVVTGWMVRTRTFTLPNLVSEWAGLGRIVPELIPHFGRVEPVIRHLLALMNGGASRQRAALAQVAQRFNAQRFSEAAPRGLLDALESGKGAD